MQYRPFGKLDWQISAPGFGAMRLPIVGGDGSKIDEAQTGEMLCYRTG
jgi:predicted aldo/keto reductase-like oxidoreductase